MGKHAADRFCPARRRDHVAAEGEGFEPSIPLRAFRFSRPADSTTLAPFRGGFTDKYTEESMDFQRRPNVGISGRVMRFAVLMTIAQLTVNGLHAQEGEWPLPAKPVHSVAGAEYGIDAFDRIYGPMHLATAYGGTRGPAGTFYGKFHVASRFRQTGAQAEAEAYPIFSRGSYGYAAYAYSGSPLFPRHRVGIEAYQAFEWSIEGSMGVRLFAFDDRRTITLLTGSASLYSGNFLISARPYVTVNVPESAWSFVASGRYYFGEAEEYVSVRIGAGFAPDERSIQSNTGFPGKQIFYLQSQTGGSGIQFEITRKVLAGIQVDLTRQELSFLPGSFVLDVSAHTSIRVIL